MNSKRITQLQEYTDPQPNDPLAIVDLAADVTKKITVRDLILGSSGYSPYITVGFSDADYICDGVDDDVQIQAAIDTASDAGGGTVFLKSGNYFTTSTIFQKSHVLVTGAGIASVITTIGNNFNCIEINNSTDAYITNFKIDALSMRATSEPNGCGIKYTNGSVRGVVKGMYVYNARIGILFEQGSSVGRIESNFIYNCRDNHIVIRKSIFADLATAQDTYDHIITNNYCDTLDVYDSITIYFTTGYAIISNNHIKNVNGSGSASAIQLEGGTNGESPLITCTGNLMRDCERGITVSSLSYASITGNAIYNSREYGMKLQNSFYSTFSNNIIVGSTRSGIWVVTNSRRLNIVGNYLINNGSVANDAGIWLNQTSLHNVSENFIQDNSDIGIYIEFCSAITCNNNFVNNNNGPQSQGIREANSSSTNNHFNDNYVSGSSGPNWTIIDGTSSTYTNNTNLNPAGDFSLGSIAGAVTINRQNGDSQIGTLTGNIVVTLSSGRVKGDHQTLVLTQDATGSRLVTWPSNFKKEGGTLTLSTGANAVDTISMVWNGTNWLETARALNLS